MKTDNHFFKAIVLDHEFNSIEDFIFMKCTNRS